MVSFVNVMDIKQTVKDTFYVGISYLYFHFEDTEFHTFLDPPDFYIAETLSNMKALNTRLERSMRLLKY